MGNKLMENDTETIIMGDFNFDFRSINKNENSKLKLKKKNNQMYNTIKSKLFTKNMIQLVKNNTREQTILDHIYTNKTNKIKNIIIKDDSFSDHSILILNRSMKINSVEENLFIYRNMKDIDIYKLENKIIENPKYINTLNESNIDISAENKI